MPEKTETPEKPKTDNTAMLKRLMQGGARRESAERAIKDHITEEDILWNGRFGRPIEFVEADKAVEKQRRAEHWESL